MPKASKAPKKPRMTQAHRDNLDYMKDTSKHAQIVERFLTYADADTLQALLGEEGQPPSLPLYKEIQQCPSANIIWPLLREQDEVYTAKHGKHDWMSLWHRLWTPPYKSQTIAFVMSRPALVREILATRFQSRFVDTNLGQACAKLTAASRKEQRGASKEAQAAKREVVSWCRAGYQIETGHGLIAAVQPHSNGKLTATFWRPSIDFDIDGRPVAPKIFEWTYTYLPRVDTWKTSSDPNASFVMAQQRPRFVQFQERQNKIKS